MPVGSQRQGLGEAGADPAGEGIELSAGGAAQHEPERHPPAAAPEERIVRVHGDQVQVEVEHGLPGGLVHAQVQQVSATSLFD